jgi:type IV pilus assembly protein PilN
LIRINLLPKTLRKRVEPGWWRLIAIAVPLVALAVMIGMQLAANGERDQLAQTRDDRTTELALLQKYITAQNELTAQQKELESTTTIKAQLERERVAWSREIRQFTAQIPRSVDNPNRLAASLQNMTLSRVDPTAATTQAATGAYDGKNIVTEVKFNAEATSLNDIETFQRAFENSDRFGINLGSLNRSQNQNSLSNNYTFDATVGLVGAVAAPVVPATPAPATGTAPAAGGQR